MDPCYESNNACLLSWLPKIKTDSVCGDLSKGTQHLSLLTDGAPALLYSKNGVVRNLLTQKR